MTTIEDRIKYHAFIPKEILFDILQLWNFFESFYDEIDGPDFSKEDLERVFEGFIGESEQLPPMFSAVKHKGKKLYELARQGKVVKREPRQIRIDQLDIEKIQLPEVQFSMKCSKGTYVRQLAHDIGDKLGCGAHVNQIRRTFIGSYDVKSAIQIEQIHEDHIQSVTQETSV